MPRPIVGHDATVFSLTAAGADGNYTEGTITSIVGRWKKITVRHLLQRRHLALSDGGAHLHARLQVLGALPFLLLADHLLDLGAQPAERLLQRRHFRHDLAYPPSQLVVGRLLERRVFRHRHTIIGQRVCYAGVDQPAEG